MTRARMLWRRRDNYAINDCVCIFHKTILLVRVRTRPNTVKTTTVRHVPGRRWRHTTVAKRTSCDWRSVRDSTPAKRFFFHRKTTLILVDGNFPRRSTNERAFPKRQVFNTSVTTADTVRLKRIYTRKLQA